MKNGIGPQNLGSQGMNPKSTPCGHSRSPLDFNEKLRAAEAAGKLPESFASAVRADDGGSPMNYQSDIDNIQAAADTLAAHNVGSGSSGGSAGGFTQAVVDPSQPNPIPSASPAGTSNAVLGPASDRTGMVEKLDLGGVKEPFRNTNRML